MKAIAQVFTGTVLSLAITAVAAAQDSPQVRAHLDAARKVAGAEWVSAANFF